MKFITPQITQVVLDNNDITKLQDTKQILSTLQHTMVEQQKKSFAYVENEEEWYCSLTALNEAIDVIEHMMNIKSIE